MKNRFKKLVISLLLGVFAFASFSGPVLAATTTDTPTAATGCTEERGFRVVSPDRCQVIAENSNLDCPPDFPDLRVPAGEGRHKLCGKKAPTADLSAQEDIRKFTTLIVSIQQFLNKLIWPVLIMIGGLLDNSLLFGGGMEERMREIWIPMRNLVNILFVVVLVGIALYNILGLGDESGNYSIKSILPKLIIGIIAVNFSFLGIKVFLDAINIGTIAIFNLPDQVNEGLGEIIDGDNVDGEVIQRFCLAMDGRKASDIANENELREIAEIELYRAAASKLKIKGTTIFEIKANASAANKTEALNKRFEVFKSGKICDGLSLSPTGEAFLSSYSSRNAALAMALNMGKIVFYQDIDANVDNIEKLVINTMFSLMLYLIYLASFIALFIVLLARLVVMWLAIVMSPIILVGIAVPEFKDKIGFSEISEKFVGSAIAPLGIALSMSIGWIMLKAMQDVESFGGSAEVFSDLSLGIPVVGISTLQDLVVALGTVAVVWMGVFTAASKSVASFATDFMKDQLQSFGTWVGTAPFKYIPFVPVHLGDKSGTYTPAQVLSAARGAMNNSQNIDKLLNDMGIQANVHRDIFDNNKIKSAPDFLSAAKAIDMNDAASQESVHKWLKSSRNGRLRTALERDSTHGPAIRQMIKAKTKEEKAAAGKALATSLTSAGVVAMTKGGAQAVASGSKKKKADVSHITTGKTVNTGSTVTYTNAKIVKRHVPSVIKAASQPKTLVRHINNLKKGLSGNITSEIFLNDVLKADVPTGDKIKATLAAASLTDLDLPPNTPADGQSRLNALLAKTT
ncbi:hypothetical protein JKY72_03415 [Candidatus Gracilibacteria bacterium]|nr:hypothetical protein [Candidatus Gracilibacteria bacterium]